MPLPPGLGICVRRSKLGHRNDLLKLPRLAGADGAKGRIIDMPVRSLLLASAVIFAATPASAQFYKDKTLTLLVNYAAGGNADTEARVFQKHLSRFIPGNPTVITRNVPGAGGAN